MSQPRAPTQGVELYLPKAAQGDVAVALVRSRSLSALALGHSYLHKAVQT